MNTPICDFVRQYAQGGAVRMHMPGHKGTGPLGVEALDITEIAGADELYHARGIIRESEDNAAALFGARRTLYSAEGSSLCIRAMLYLALIRARRLGLPARLLAGRNAHKTLMTASALLDIDIDWIFPRPGEGLLRCTVSPQTLESRLARERYMAVYITSPDYLGNMADVAGLAAVCHAHGVPLLVDNAHGAYLRFLPRDSHPLSLGADLCCDSAHKTLPCLTGAAYLHIGQSAPEPFAALAEPALSLFASTSPSYLILQSLDAANPCLAGDFGERLAACAARTAILRETLQNHGYTLTGDEPMKLALTPKPYGYTGDDLHALLGQQGIACEFSDPDHLVLMPGPMLPEAGYQRLERALLDIPPRAAIVGSPPDLPPPERVCSIRQAMLSPQAALPVSQCLGRVLADAHMGCPPAVPILAAGERINADALNCFAYYGREECRVMAP
ncbi:MAG: PLP-dependent transferase [Clostridia bacterium]|nr:PLP-dependent transferase [Clostridia bacterium]